MRKQFTKTKQAIVRLYNSRFLNRRIILLIDVVVAWIALGISLLLFCYFKNISQAQFSNLYIPLGLLATVTTLFSDLLFSTYRRVFRYATMHVGFRLLASILTNGLLLGLFSGIVLNSRDVKLEPLQLAFIVLCFLIAFFVLVVGYSSILTFIARQLTNQSSPRTRKRILIFGKDEESVYAFSSIKDNAKYSFVGFIDMSDKKDIRKYRIDGYKIYHAATEDDVIRICHKLNVLGIVFPGRSFMLSSYRTLIQKYAEMGIKSLTIPAIDELKAGNIARSTMRDIRIEDLLQRPVIEHSHENSAALFRDKVVLITGAAGSIGSELAKQVAGLGVRQLILFDNAETPLHNIRLALQNAYPELNFVPIIGDVRSEQRLTMVFERFHPQIVLHAAAYKHVPLMEGNPCEAVLVNTLGSKRVADLSLRYGVEKMVMISTDKAVNPSNVMGASKRAAEIYVQSLGKAEESGQIKGSTIFITTRFGNVLGSQGSVFPLFRQQIAKGGPVTVTHPDIVRFFMSIKEACNLVIEAAAYGTATQIFVFDMGEKHKIVDLAESMISLAGFVPYKEIDIQFTGLRPGEKLYEEVLANKENTIPTELDKVMIACVRENALKEVQPYYKKLEELALNVAIDDTVRVLKELIPEYKSLNSEFADMDKAEEKNQQHK